MFIQFAHVMKPFDVSVRKMISAIKNTSMM